MISKIVETNKGLIEGIEEERGYRFLGVPFVKAPIGDLSFKRPKSGVVFIRPINLKQIQFKKKALLVLDITIKILYT